GVDSPSEARSGNPVAFGVYCVWVAMPSEAWRKICASRVTGDCPTPSCEQRENDTESEDPLRTTAWYNWNAGVRRGAGRAYSSHDGSRRGTRGSWSAGPRRVPRCGRRRETGEESRTRIRWTRRSAARI